MMLIPKWVACAVMVVSSWTTSGKLRAQEEAASMGYKVEIKGIEDRGLRKELERISISKSLSDRPPRTRLQLRRRAQRDVPIFEQILRNQGFYAVSVRLALVEGEGRSVVRFDIEPGAPYHFRDIRLHSSDSEVELPEGVLPGLKSGEVAVAEKVLQANGVLLRHLQGRGHAFASVTSREVRVVHADRAVDVTFEVRPGPVFRFGDTAIYGLESVEESFIRRKIPWDRGAIFDIRALARARRRFTSADLFATIRVLHAEEPEEDLLPVRIELSERPHRSMSFGVGYGNDQGWRARAGWEHRNILKRGERLTLEAGVSEVGQENELTFRRPDVRRVDQNLTLSVKQSVEDTRAFRSNNVGTLARLDRSIRRNRIVSAGVGMRYASVKTFEDDQEFNLLYVPAGLSQDRSDDPLDPRSGTRLSLRLAPYWDTLNTETFFVKTGVSFSVYRLLSQRYQLDWAGRISAATALGASRSRIPADERYYAGGGGSVRGYRFQTVGPLEEGNPAGGRSQFLIGQELRWRWTESFGVAGFVDGGVVTEEAVFESGVDEMRWGTGLGIRYYTPVGPLRLDMAVPIDRRKDIDDAWQFYISLGQAF